MTSKPPRNPISKPKRMVPGAAEAVAETLHRAGSRRTVAFAGRHMPPSADTPVSAVIDWAVNMGLLTANTHQVGARLPLELVEQAKKRTGIASTTHLLAFALANVAVEDDFAKAFKAARGKLDPDLDIGF